jgi:hypothetical protein
MFSSTRKITVLFEVFHNLPACPSDKVSIVMSVYGIKDPDKEILGEELIPLPVW